MVIFAKVITTSLFGGLGLLALLSLVDEFRSGTNWTKDENYRMAFAAIWFLACLYIVIALWA